MNEIIYYTDYYYNEKDYFFYHGDKKTRFKDLLIAHKGDKETIKEGEIYQITIDNYIYQFDSPQDVLFIFPDENNKDKDKTDKNNEEKKVFIFISSYIHIDEILFKYKDYNFYYRKDGKENFNKFKRTDLNRIFPVKEIKISFKNYEDIYKLNNKLINNYSELNRNHLFYHMKNI